LLTINENQINLQLNNHGQQLNSDGQQLNSDSQQLNSRGKQLNSYDQQLKQLVNFIICSCELNAPFFVIYKAGHKPTLYW
jgi:hypothetical protein